MLFMAESVDICVIGGGSGGLSVAAGAALMGASVVLVERAKMGGDCLNYGCVPSKSMIAAARTAQIMRSAGRFGISPVQPDVDFARVNDHIHGVIGEIAPNDSVERFEGLGVRVIKAHAKFTSPTRVVAGETEIEARRFVISTGSSPLILPIPGIESLPYLTNETIFDNRHAPEHLIVIGGGPIGSELAQAHRRLGCRVTVLEKFSVLGRNDPELADVVRRRMVEEGVDLHEGVDIVNLSGTEGRILATLEKDDKRTTIEGSHLLVAVGRTPNLDGVGAGGGRN